MSQHSLNLSAPGLPDPSLLLKWNWNGNVLGAFFKHDPNRLAVVLESDEWSYGELNQASQFLASHLLERIGSGEKIIAVRASRSPSLVVALLAIIRNGWAFAIIDPNYPLDRIKRYLQIIHPSATIKLSHGRKYDRNEEDDWPPGQDCYDLELPEGKGPLWDYLANLDKKREWEDTEVSENFLLYVASTSGTTGMPKVIHGGHGPVSHFLEWQQRSFGLKEGLRVSLLSGLAHDPLLRDLFCPLRIGGTICIPPPEVYSIPGRLLNWVGEHRVQLIHMTPSLAHLMLVGMDTQLKTTLPDLKFIFFGGETLRYDLVARIKAVAPRAAIINCYGCTETPQVMSFHVIKEHERCTTGGPEWARQIVPIGHGIDQVQLLILDDQNRLCVAGQKGQIYIRTPYRAKGIKNGGLTSCDSYVANPFRSDAADSLYCSGDSGYYLPDGEAVLLERQDKQVKVRGYRIQLEEIENALGEIMAAGRHVVDVEPVAGSDHRIVVYICWGSERPLSTPELRSRLAKKLPEFMLPEKFFMVEAFPITANGKIDLKALRAAAEKGSPTVPVSSLNSMDIKTRLTNILRESLGQALLSDDELTSNGLNSIGAIELSCQLEKEWGVILSAWDIISCRSIAGLADRIAQVKASAIAESRLTAEPKVEVSNPAAKNNSPLTHPKSSHVFAEKRIALIPKNESLLAGIKNRLFQLIARVSPDALRARLHRWRGVQIGQNVSIGYDTIIETSYPWLVRIGDNVNIGMRVTIIGHFRGMVQTGKHDVTVKIGDNVFVGPAVVILPGVTIGEGSVVTAGSIVSASIPPRTFAHGNPAVPTARCGLPLAGSTTYEEFLNNLHYD